MLWPADAELCRRDRALPGLATLLDPDAFRAALVGLTKGPPAEAARITYVRYKPGRSCLVGYRLSGEWGNTDVVATAYLPGAVEKLRKANARPGRLALRGGEVVVTFFPDDEALPALSRIACPHSRPALLRKLLPELPDLWEGAVELVRYKPGRRYVGRWLVDRTPRAALKFYASPGVRAALGNAKAFEPCAAFRTPRRLGRSGRHGVLALEWLPGCSLHDALADPNLPGDTVESVGAALAALHVQSAPGLAVRRRAEEAAGPGQLAVWLGNVCPALAGRARTLAGQLGALLEGLPPAGRPVHGDFHARQVLVGCGSVGLLDFDDAVRGDPALDLGSFLAQLHRDALLGGVPASRVAPARTALLRGYRSTGARPATAHVHLYTAVGLLRLAPHPFRDREVGWPERTAALLDGAEAELRAALAPVPIPVGPGGGRDR